MRIGRGRWVVAAVSLMSGGASFASPGPPPPDYIMASVKRVVPTATATTFDASVADLAPDLTVTVNGETVARDKAAWVATERHRLGKLDRRVLSYTLGWDSILVLDQYDDHSDVPPGAFSDARPRTRAVRYAFGEDHLVHTIRIVETEGLMLRP
ncbi:hypothetical protein [uncultured Sphingomonas sp.]|uniref:hypothetical protein n=1 Tax=uncultured Sphingomonas sp. TaxID=158754 RepID=UPI0026004B5E|nr:hypothetical protein [uncultured Sphingomonas sp.]